MDLQVVRVLFRVVAGVGTPTPVQYRKTIFIFDTAPMSVLRPRPRATGSGQPEHQYPPVVLLKQVTGGQRPSLAKAQQTITFPLAV
jgi:hypothetical protein